MQTATPQVNFEFLKNKFPRKLHNGSFLEAIIIFHVFFRLWHGAMQLHWKITSLNPKLSCLNRQSLGKDGWLGRRRKIMIEP